MGGKGRRGGKGRNGGRGDERKVEVFVKAGNK
jgi:hypothetical protein